MFYISAYGLLSFVITAILLYKLTRVSDKIGLIDAPIKHKNHHGDIPVVGGLAITLSTMLLLFLGHSSLSVDLVYSGTIGFLMVVGAFDDRYDISVRFRLFAQTVAFLLVTNVFDAPFHYSLGAIFGGDSIDIGWFGLPFSWLLYLAIINAFNMIDGIDGLLASLAMTAMAGIGIITYQSHADIFALAVVLFGALNAFLISNLFSSRVTVKKSFMGDAGSMVIGFSIAWMLHVITQDSSSANVATFSPVTALFFITVPMFDLVATLLRRLKLGKSPFLSDKNHIHHIMLRAGYSERKTLISLFMASVSSVICGLGMHFTGVSEHVQVTVYLFALSIYILTTVLFDGVAPTVKLKKDA